MNKKSAFGSLLMLVALLFQSFVLPQPAAAATCDAAQFIADVTIPDGTNFAAGQAFTKTWRLKNTGTCTWSTNYKLVFFSGSQLGAPASVNFPNSVAPGGTIDLSVTMTAPNTTGSYISYWKLKNASGALFGISSTADKSFWVDIRVNNGSNSGPSVRYNFAENASAATWTNGPGTRVDNPKLENGTIYNGAGLEMILPNSTDSLMRAMYPAIHVQSGDHFQSIVNCEFQATSCFVSFRLDYQIGTNPVQNFWTFRERYEGAFYTADRDLSSLAGQDVKFILQVDALGSAAGDRVIWAGPRITNANTGPTVTGTPPTATNTPPPHSGADRALFIADQTVPDGTTFTANTAFNKIWRVKNVGSSTWTTAFKLVFVSGDQMSASNEFSLSSTVAPNTTVDLPAVGMIAPSVNGHYRGFWQLKNASGALFGIGPAGDKPFWVDIFVTGGNNFTRTPTVTGTPPTPTMTSSVPTKSPTPNFGPDRASFVSDVSIPDGTGFGPNAPFTKIWRIRNTGSSTWTTAFKLVYDSGSQMSGPAEQNLPATVAPNATIDISVNLTSPAANGTYRGYWMLKNASGQKFGIGSTANRPFWVDIFVTGAGPTVTPTRTATSQAGSAPDLIVLSVLADGNQVCFSSTFRVGVRVVVKNNGNANIAGSFVVDVNGVQQTYSAGLAPGQTASLWFDTGGSSATAFVDSTNVVPESDENNNKLTQQLLVLTAPPPCATGTTTPTPTITATAGTRTITPTPTGTGTGTTGTCDRASMVADLTIPDDTQFGPNTSFTKTWRLQNVGTCTWTTSYQLAFFSGSQMGGPNTVNLPSNVAPNSTVDLSVTLTSPAANGTYRGYWKLKNASGTLFGIGAAASDPFWVEIVVQGGSAGPTATLTKTPTPGTATATTQACGSYAVVNLSNNDLLYVFPTPAVSTQIASLDYNINNISRISTATTNTGEWWQIVVPGDGNGWVYAFYMTEYVAPANFCGDAKVAALLANLGNALKNSDGGALAALVSPRHGLNIHLATSNVPVNYDQDSATAVFASTAVRNWGPDPASGLTVNGAFKDVILPKLNEVYNANYVLTCNDTSKVGPVSQPWPFEYTSINFYSIYKPPTATGGQDWRDLLLGIEYVNGQPYLFSLINFASVP